MAAKTVLNYLPRKSVVHQLTGTTKLAFFLYQKCSRGGQPPVMERCPSGLRNRS